MDGFRYAPEADEGQAYSQPKYTVVVNDAPKFELASYISNYKGRTVLTRLYLIASCCPPLREEATKMLIAEVKKGSDTIIYQDAISLLNQSHPPADGSTGLDMAWLEMKEKQNAAETVRLEGELKGYKNNLIKESIRMGNEDLGSHYHKIGDLGSALKAFARMRDYCTTPAHIASTAFNIILVGIEQRHWLAVQSQVHKIRNLRMKPDDAAKSQPKTTVAQGLHHMCMGEYKEGARNFLETDPGLTDSFNEVISMNDVAIYGGLCALASMSRAELQEEVLENSSFRNFLELEPQIRRAINLFCASKYGQCLEILEGYRADYLLDIYLQDHVADIFKQVRTKSIIQYFEPFSRVTLAALSETFGPTPVISSSSKSGSKGGSNGTSTSNSTVPIENELIKLIETGQLSALIDLEDRVLVAKERDLRAELYEETSESIENFINEARLKLLRTNVNRAGLEITPSSSKKSTWGNDLSSDSSVPESWGASAYGAAPAGGRNTRSGKGKEKEKEKGNY